MKKASLKNSVLLGLLVLPFFMVIHSCKQQAKQVVSADGLDRTSLPVKAPLNPTFTELDVRNVKMPERFQVKAPEGAPNVILVLVDDLGFAGTSTFGGPVATPNFDKVASEGIYYNNFHTTALCSPTRACIKSGRNHHVNNMGFITEMATGMPGATGEIPQNITPVAEILRLNGYSTGAFGKWHETATWETSVSGPFDRWPQRQGFDKFYGFFGGETNQWAPFVYDGTHVVELPEDPNYHFMNDMTNQAEPIVIPVDFKLLNIGTKTQLVKRIRTIVYAQNASGQFTKVFLLPRAFTDFDKLKFDYLRNTCVYDNINCEQIEFDTYDFCSFPSSVVPRILDSYGLVFETPGLSAHEMYDNDAERYQASLIIEYTFAGCDF